MPDLEEFLAKAGNGPVLVSACLLGLSTRYDGGCKTETRLVEYAKTHCVVPICPEQLGGLPTPRPKSSFVGGDGSAVLKGRAKVLSETGREVTENFLRGAKQAAALAKLVGARFAVLKEQSPSCGVMQVHVGGKIVDGCGVTTAVLKASGFEVFAVQ